MRPALPNDVLHNPFNNRFNDPVTRRHDEMQASAYMVWLRERNQSAQGQFESDGSSAAAKQTARTSDVTTPWMSGRIFGSLFALVLVLLVVVLFKLV
jgi:hypothetical protein